MVFSFFLSSKARCEASNWASFPNSMDSVEEFLSHGISRLAPKRPIMDFLERRVGDTAKPTGAKVSHQGSLERRASATSLILQVCRGCRTSGRAHIMTLDGLLRLLVWRGTLYVLMQLAVRCTRFSSSTLAPQDARGDGHGTLHVILWQYLDKVYRVSLKPGHRAEH